MFAPCPRPRQPAFGRRQPFVATPATAAAPVLGDDLKLFAANFVGGFAFVLIYLS